MIETIDEYILKYQELLNGALIFKEVYINEKKETES